MINENIEVVSSPSVNDTREVLNPMSAHLGRQNKLAMVLTACLLICLIVIGYFVYQNKLLRTQLLEKNQSITSPKIIVKPEEPTSLSNEKWSTYSDNLYDFQIQYPPDWTVTKDPIEAGGDYAIFWVAQKPEKGFEAANALLVLQPVAGHINLKNWIEDEKNTSPGVHVPDFSLDQIKYDDTGTKAIIKKCDSICYYYVYQQISDNIYVFIVSTAIENDSLVENIRASLKLL